jgi:hypothetical protein
MQIQTIPSGNDRRFALTRGIGSLLLLLTLTPTAYAAVYKCAAKDGSTTFSDQPCGQNAQVIEVTPEPLHSAPKSAQKGSNPGAGADDRARAKIAALCTTKTFNDWVKAQGRPFPDPSVRMAKMTEIRNQCRSALNLAIANPPSSLASSAPTQAAMQEAADRADLEAVRLMVKHDQKMHDIKPGVTNWTLRIVVLGTDHLEERKQIAELLLADGAEIDNSGPEADITPLMLANTPGMVEFLLVHGANTHLKLRGAYIAHWYVCNPRLEDTLGALQILLKHGIEIGGAVNQFPNVLGCAAQKKNPALTAFMAAHQVGVSRPGD